MFDDFKQTTRDRIVFQVNRVKAKARPRRRLENTAFRFRSALDRRFLDADVAYMDVDHALARSFMGNLRRHTGANIHFLPLEADFSEYRKVIVPNGHAPWFKDPLSRIPPERRVYLEVGFFPQAGNIYFDHKGIHGWSSVRDAELAPLGPTEKRELEEFRAWYTAHNFSKSSFSLVEHEARETGRYDFPFIFLPLQLERDTAFDLCPFPDNQAIIDFVQDTFPDWTLIVKVHPRIPTTYRVREGNILLPAENRDLQELLVKARYVVGVNSTVLLEALMHGKTVASLGTGFSTNHHVCLECHEDRSRLRELPSWKPDPDQVDRFLYYLLQKQVSISFWKDPREQAKLESHLRHHGILEGATG